MSLGELCLFSTKTVNKNMSKIIKNEGLQFELVEDGTVNVIKGESSLTGELTIPDSIEFGGKTCLVVSIGKRAFHDCIHLTCIKLQ